MTFFKTNRNEVYSTFTFRFYGDQFLSCVDCSQKTLMAEVLQQSFFPFCYIFSSEVGFNSTGISRKSHHFNKRTSFSASKEKSYELLTSSFKLFTVSNEILHLYYNCSCSRNVFFFQQNNLCEEKCYQKTHDVLMALEQQIGNLEPLVLPTPNYLLHQYGMIFYK